MNKVTNAHNYLNKPKKLPTGFVSFFVVVFVLPIISSLFIFPDLTPDCCCCCCCCGGGGGCCGGCCCCCCCCCCRDILLDSVLPLPSYFIDSQSFSGIESFCVRLKSVIVSAPVPHMNISFPRPPVSVSLPGPPINMSFPLSPYILSFPSSPSIRSFPAFPFNTSLPSLP